MTQQPKPKRMSVFEYPNIRTESGCLEFGGPIVNGYGYSYVDGHLYRAHRRAWEETNGPIVDDLTVDHVCRNTRCIEPTHLRLLTRADNTSCSMRAEEQKAKTHCPQGHAYEGSNVYIDKRGARHCMTCTRERTKAWQAKQKEERAKRRAERNTCRNGLHQMTPENTRIDGRGCRTCIICSQATKLRYALKERKAPLT